ncbi:NADH-quinone oxidoreductase subunit B [bacterium]|nr:NADH-quinone oxidoreductase subunit B [bacterium]NUN44968.1 NADH-quinone oxidoreductase subunit B [bacterium]HMW32008.1 NADH-quinone oxidoreductase subunit B family protein [bacterium]HMW34875.1 NADH-quinone oxidoreductase subunit B family protein [bacterium]HMY34593.1 NADH-quinone oxidoreductase subunit B family protein [bacterium]
MDLTKELKDNVLLTTVEAVYDWGRRNSLWPMPFGTACCAIEMMATLGPRYDMSRFGSEAIRFSPRQADLMIVSGRVSIKMMPVLKRIWDQMPEPKWCISMGACASTGGFFNTYTLIQGVDQFIPVDVYVPGCPPRPEGLIEGVMKIQKLIAKREAAYARDIKDDGMYGDDKVGIAGRGKDLVAEIATGKF